MEAIQRISHRKMQVVDPRQPWPDPKKTTVTRNEVVRELVSCGYVKAADVVDRFGDPSSLNPELDPDIVGSSGVFSQAEYDADAEFRKTAAVMKMVLSGYAGAGTITMGGYDYHGQGRATGEVRDLRAGRCMGACLEYAARRGMPLMLYVFSDGSLSASGQVDNTVDGRGKFMWTSDNQSTAASFFLVYNPRGRPTLVDTGAGGAARHQQIGRDGLESRGQQRQPAGRDRGAELHGAAWRARPVRAEVPAQRARLGRAAGQPDRVQPDRERTHRLTQPC
jgi:hypothetical protein